MRPRTCVGLHVVIEDSIRTGGRTWDVSVFLVQMSMGFHGISTGFPQFIYNGTDYIYIYIIYIYYTYIYIYHIYIIYIYINGNSADFPGTLWRSQTIAVGWYDMIIGLYKREWYGIVIHSNWKSPRRRNEKKHGESMNSSISGYSVISWLEDHLACGK
jgi:hypothetical protein